MTSWFEWEQRLAKNRIIDKHAQERINKENEHGGSFGKNNCNCEKFS